MLFSSGIQLGENTLVGKETNLMIFSPSQRPKACYNQKFFLWVSFILLNTISKKPKLKKKQYFDLGKIKFLSVVILSHPVGMR